MIASLCLLAIDTDTLSESHTQPLHVLQRQPNLLSSHPVLLFLLGTTVLAVAVLIIVGCVLATQSSASSKKNDDDIDEFADDEAIQSHLSDSEEEEEDVSDSTRQRKGKSASSSSSNKSVQSKAKKSVSAPIQLTQTKQKSAQKRSVDTRAPVSSQTQTLQLSSSANSENPLLYRELKGHTAPLTSCYYSHDSQFIVTSSLDCTVRIWLLQHLLRSDVDSFTNQQLLAQLSPTSAQQTKAALATLATTTVPFVRVNLHNKATCTFAVLSENSELLVCACTDGTIQVYEIDVAYSVDDSGREVDKPVLTVTFAYDFHTVFSDKTPLSQMVIDPYSSFVFAFSHSAADTRAYVYALSTLKSQQGKLLQTIDAKQLRNTSADVSRDGTLLALATQQGDCRVFAIRRKQPQSNSKSNEKDNTSEEAFLFDKLEQLATLTGHSSSVTSIALSSDNAVCMTGSSNGQIRCFDLAFDYRSKVHETRERYNIQTSIAIDALAVCPILDNQLVSVASERHMYLCRLADGALLGELNGCLTSPHAKVDCISYAGDGTMSVYCSRAENKAYVSYTPSVEVEEIDPLTMGQLQEEKKRLEEEKVQEPLLAEKAQSQAPVTKPQHSSTAGGAGGGGGGGKKNKKSKKAAP